MFSTPEFKIKIENRDKTPSNPKTQHISVHNDSDEQKYWISWMVSFTN